MKQVLRHGIKDIVVHDVPTPEVLSHHVLIQAAYSLISTGTECASIHSEGTFQVVAQHPEHLSKLWKAFKEHGPLPTAREVMAKFHEYSVIGYAGAGVIVEKHATVRDLEIGDRVAYGGEGTGHAEYVLAGTNYVAKVPECVPMDSAAFTTLGSIALNAVRTAGIQLGDVVVVEGLGLVGQLISQLARLQGGIVVGTDLRKDRLCLAEQLGAHYVAQADASVLDLVSRITKGRGADRVIIAAASKSAGPAQQALALCRERGRIVVVGAVDLSFPWEQMYLKEIQVSMSRAYGAGCYDAAYERGGKDYPVSHVRWTANRNMEEFLRILSSGQIQVQPLISHQFPLEQAAFGYETILNPQTRSLAVVIRYPDVLQARAEGATSPKPQRRLETGTTSVPPAAPSATRSDLNVAVVGAGNLTRWVHSPLLQKAAGVKIRAVVSKSGPRGANYARRFGAEYCTTSYDEALSDPQIDLVVIASRNAEHGSQSVAALRAGKHVFVEKPVAITETECQELVEEFEKGDRRFTVGFNRRFAPVYLETKEHLVGRNAPAIINCRVNSPGISGSYWMAAPESGGALIGEACHFVDLFYWLLESEPVSVAAFSLPRGGGEPIGENNLCGSFAFSDGSVANLTYCTTGNQRCGGERLEVFTPGIRIVSEDFKHLRIDGGSRITRNFWFPKKGYAAQMQNFLHAVRSGISCEPSIYDGVRATVCCLRMLQSAASSQSLPIEFRPFNQTSASAA